MEITEIDRILLEGMAVGGAVANSDVDTQRLDDLVKRGLAVKKHRQAPRPGQPVPGPVYRITNLGEAVLADER